MSLWTSLEPASATVDPGSTTRVRLRVRNTGDVVDEYRFEPFGDVAPWTRIEPQTLRLYPGTTGTVELTFAPPRTSDAVAGPNPYAVRITPTEHPDAVTVPEGNLTITAFTEVRAELVPPTVKGRFRGRPRLAVDNVGNTKVTASIGGSDNGDHLSYEIRPANVQIEPGRAAFVETTLKPKQKIWFGSKEERPYTLAVRRSGVDPTEVEGTYVQRGFLPRWLATFFGIGLALSLAFVMIWIAYKPQVASKATEQTEEAGAALPPSPSATPETLPSSPESAPAEDPQPEPSASDTDGNGGGGGDGDGGGGGGDKPKKKSVLPAIDVMLFNPTTKMCADIPGREKGKIGGPVQQANCHPTGDNERWNLEVKYEKGGGPDSTPLFQIRNTTDMLCMDMELRGARPVGTPIIEATCTGTKADNQLWWLDKQESGDYWIRNYSSNNKCLNVKGKDGPTETPLNISDCTNLDDQEWRIVKPKTE
ncbi:MULTISPECIES: RICIN domain-containing protein [Streptomyces]|uniref:RICIN domain-containing protein n=1 Tax=Streptomyces TaxID=1883 RepID=UPI000996CF41|nr:MULTISPECIES: ricin-type beta-trefoil lectin domain protein [Streptomyces]MBZ6110979.1 RICIN domain-containing protein [Streptomyces olivaceus]MBZ6126346.1 RICIN domain-containing protein [Streptomyces olivaceus]MBZ6145316.1 RICIN domain-containing protein [Streptomyces olivaceus]MBZ6159678.1 RICIN domain-containing protein [Streptomyces olivaceus]MBZ6187457.1 RICIN domain-containing protein [Streptomyces olivaceus]